MAFTIDPAKANQSEHPDDRSNRFRGAAASCPVCAQISSRAGATFPSRRFGGPIIFLCWDQWSLSDCNQYDSCGPGGITPDAGSRRPDRSSRFLDSFLGSIRWITTVADLDISFDHERPPHSTAVSSGVVADHMPFERQHNMAAAEICV